jgi:hypothetical protein
MMRKYYLVQTISYPPLGWTTFKLAWNIFAAREAYNNLEARFRRLIYVCIPGDGVAFPITEVLEQDGE